ncbi:hypothetical protein B0H13DRAFT_2263783 [Mycena leptocephala]|nr:hypothetical protein B0H13DRAFT_2263783 [Mycena leptocephala]
MSGIFSGCREPPLFSARSFMLSNHRPSAFVFCKQDSFTPVRYCSSLFYHRYDSWAASYALQEKKERTSHFHAYSNAFDNFCLCLFRSHCTREWKKRGTLRFHTCVLRERRYQNICNSYVDLPGPHDLHGSLDHCAALSELGGCSILQAHQNRSSTRGHESIWSVHSCGRICGSAGGCGLAKQLAGRSRLEYFHCYGTLTGGPGIWYTPRYYVRIRLLEEGQISGRSE